MILESSASMSTSRKHRLKSRFRFLLVVLGTVGALTVGALTIALGSLLQSAQMEERRILNYIKSSDEGIAHLHSGRGNSSTTTSTDFDRIVVEESDREEGSIESEATASAAASNERRIDNKSKNEETTNDPYRPWFVIHVGPPKTASTFLQCSICSNYYPKEKDHHQSPSSSTNQTDPTHIYHEQYFLQDNYTYIGTCPCFGAGGASNFVAHGHHAIFINPTTWDTSHELGPFPFSNTTRLINISVQEEEEQTKLPQLRRPFRRLVRDVHERGHHALFVFEGCHKFDSAHVAALAKFLKPLFRVRILVAYRRLYEWLPSKYNSISKPSRNRDISNWPGHVDIGRRGKLRKSLELQPFHLNFDAPTNNHSDQSKDTGDGDEFDKLVHDIVATQRHPTQVVRDNYALYFDHVHVIPLHALPDEKNLPLPVPDDSASDSMGDSTANKDSSKNATNSLPTRSPYLYHLFCITLVETTPHVCRAIATGDFKLSKADNPSVSLDYDRIAVAAHRRGWVPSITARREVAQQVQRYYSALKRRQRDEENEDSPLPPIQPQLSYPQECLPPATLDRLLDLSLMMEEQLFGHDLASQWKSHHRQAFESYKERSKYCWLDTEKLLEENDEWISFLKQLGETYAMDEITKAAAANANDTDRGDNDNKEQKREELRSSQQKEEDE